MPTEPEDKDDTDDDVVPPPPIDINEIRKPVIRRDGEIKIPMTDPPTVPPIERPPPPEHDY